MVFAILLPGAIAGAVRCCVIPPTEILRVTLPGPAVGAARPRVVARRDGRGVVAYMPKKSKGWEANAAGLISAALPARHLPTEVAVAVELTVYVARPVLHREHRKRSPKAKPERWGTGKPDLDNVVKLAMDACTRARVWSDDSRVAEIDARRRWLPIDDDGADIGAERVELAVFLLGGEP